MPLTDSADLTLGLPESPLALRVRAARGGDRAAFGRLVEDHWRDLVGLARSVLAGSGDAEDVVQDALVLAWQRLATLREPDRFAAWVRRIVVRCCLRHVRRTPPGQEAFEIAVPPAENDARLDVHRALRRLSPRQRAVVHLTAEGHSDSEIGRILGLFPATVRVHRSRALRALRRLLGERT